MTNSYSQYTPSILCIDTFKLLQSLTNRCSVEILAPHRRMSWQYKIHHGTTPKRFKRLWYSFLEISEWLGLVAMCDVPEFEWTSLLTKGYGELCRTREQVPLENVNTFINSGLTTPTYFGSSGAVASTK